MLGSLECTNDDSVQHDDSDKLYVNLESFFSSTKSLAKLRSLPCSIRIDYVGIWSIKCRHLGWSLRCHPHHPTALAVLSFIRMPAGVESTKPLDGLNESQHERSEQIIPLSNALACDLHNK